MDGFPSTAELRERVAVEAADALKPITPLFVSVAAALLIASVGMFWAALSAVDSCLALAGSV